MKLLSLTPLLLVLLLLGAAPAHAQFGYAVQAPAAGSGLPPGGGFTANPYTVAGGAGFTQQQNFGPAAATMPVSSMLTYGQLEGRYVYNTFKTDGVASSSGLALGLTAQLFNPFFLHADFNWSSTSGSGSGLSSKSYDFSTISIGGGGYFAITDRVHLVAEVGGLYSSLSASKDKLSFSDGAIYMNPKLRFLATEVLELDVGLLLTSADNYNSSVLQLGGYWRMFSSMDLGGGVDFGDMQNSYHVGVRFRW
jgi:hypothetical protein